jgi:hypothetical protein
MRTGIAWGLAGLLALSTAGMVQGADAPEKKNVLSNVDVQIYGYTRLDIAYDTSRVFPGNYAVYVKSEGTYNDDNQMNMTANQTRLGLNFSGPEVAEAKTTAKIETDFYGGGSAAENKPNLMLRQGYFELTWLNLNLSMLAGQAWDIFAPLLPDAVNYPVYEYFGEIGYRHPQLRFTENINVGEKSVISAKVAASRDMGHTVAPATVNGGLDSGTEAATPQVQGSVTFSGPLWTSAPATICLSGVWGREECDMNAGAVNPKIYPVWGAAIDAQLPLAEGFSLKGSVWKGADLEDYMGGVGQGINLAGQESVELRGGWVELCTGPWAGTKVNLGAAIEMPRYDQVPDVAADALSTSWRIQDSAIFANAIYSLTSNIQVALEISQLRTLYKQIAAGDAVRTQMAFIYNF